MSSQPARQAYLVISVDKVYHMFYLQCTKERHIATWAFDGQGGLHWKHVAWTRATHANMADMHKLSLE